MASQSSHKLRVMLDTNVLISGMVWPRWSYEILRLARQGKIELVICQFTLDELY
ncbi:MAG: PIN domain-containing protein [Aggregatilineales bacterium]